MLEQLAAFFAKLYDLPALVQWAGYVGLALIVFAETGLLIGFFLPGDSLLVTAGLFAATGYFNIFLLLAILIPAAIIGDAVGYFIGARIGTSLYCRPDSFFFRKSHLQKAKAFYDKHGAKTIILARFVPLVRTFAPVVAGASGMPYARFAVYNIVGGILWVAGMVLLGYFLGKTIPDVDRYLLPVIGAIVLLSLLPVIREYLSHTKKS